jgi:hypothetical protein
MLPVSVICYNGIEGCFKEGEFASSIFLQNSSNFLVSFWYFLNYTFVSCWCERYVSSRTISLLCLIQLCGLEDQIIKVGIWIEKYYRWGKENDPEISTCRLAINIEFLHFLVSFWYFLNYTFVSCWCERYVSSRTISWCKVTSSYPDVQPNIKISNLQTHLPWNNLLFHCSK